MSALDDTVMAQIESAGAAGFVIEGLSGRTATDVDSVVRKLIRLGRVHKGKIGHRTVRFFSRPEWAAAYQEQRVAATAVIAAGRGARSKATWSSDTPATYPTNPDGTPAYKVTVCPGHRPHPTKIRTGYYEP